jgi:leucyl/phenylalanyl-tRNA--protein transferase
MASAYYKLPSGYVLALDGETSFPALSDALIEPNGLISIGGDLSTTRLLSAYKQGIFPWFSEGEPIMWWSPNPRMVLYPDELKISKSLNKTLKNSTFETRINTAFPAVIKACSNTSRSNQPSTHESNTWITNDMINAYCESMFHLVTDASKIAFVHLVQYLKSQQVGMIDCQMKTPLLSSFGGREISRDDFIQTLSKLVNS